MTYVEGFLTPVPTANKDAYKKHAEGAIDLFLGLGATRFVEAWGDDVPDGKTNDLKKAVDLKDDETVLFSWLEYPDKATRDEANRKMMENPDLMNMDMPFDGSRMIFAGFEPFVEVGEGKGTGYLDGYVLPVPAGNKDAYKAMAEKAAAVFREYGALRVVEAWGEETPDGKKTDYNRATLRKDDERVVYSWVEWPSKEARDAAWPKMMEDERMKPDFSNMPFDGQRMMWGGFAPLFDAKG
ncbi:DUF1428 domain-containing protein [Sphingomonas sp. DT-207]|uniref:DUF1428 domain-containing protein n=1 Tax=Sphingomonas sp. DT-207 TaxID=3396167 RepID=UPI003F195951